MRDAVLTVELMIQRHGRRQRPPDASPPPRELRRARLMREEQNPDRFQGEPAREHDRREGPRVRFNTQVERRHYISNPSEHDDSETKISTSYSNNDAGDSKNEGRHFQDCD